MICRPSQGASSSASDRCYAPLDHDELARAHGCRCRPAAYEEWPPQLSTADERAGSGSQRLYDTRARAPHAGRLCRLVREIAGGRAGGRIPVLELPGRSLGIRCHLRRDYRVYRAASRWRKAARASDIGIGIIIAANDQASDGPRAARLAGSTRGRASSASGSPTNERRGPAADFVGFQDRERAGLRLVPHAGELFGRPASR